MSRPLCSVITGTWQRNGAVLENAIPQVRRQTYPNLEHVIVSEGPDPELHQLLAALLGRAVPIHYAECGRNWSTFLTDSFSTAPWLVGSLMARGEYLTWLADDDVMRPEHIAGLVDLLEETGADFAYSQAIHVWAGRPETAFVIGSDPPQRGHIANVVHRASLLDRGIWQFGDGMLNDWALISRWLEAGARWAYLPRPTFIHTADHGGPDGD